MANRHRFLDDFVVAWYQKHGRIRLGGRDVSQFSRPREAGRPFRSRFKQEMEDGTTT
jgi:hypothetical protein